MPTNHAPLRINTARLFPLLIASVSLLACQRDPLAPAPSEPTAEVALALTGVPADVACVAINIAYQQSTQQRRFDVKAGDSTFALSRLPVGLVIFSVEALASPCAQGGSAETASWYGGPVSVTLKPGVNAAIAIEMRPNGQATVTIGFDAGGPTCGAVGAFCAGAGDCCSQRCQIDPASSSGIGTCAAPVADAGVEAPPSPPDMTPAADVAPQPPKTVEITLEGATNYLFYPFDGGKGCGEDSPGTYQAMLSGTQKICVDDALWDSTYAVLLKGNPQVCTAGKGCQPCAGAECRPERCFKKVPEAPSGSCKHELSATGGVGTRRYVFFKRVDPAGDYSGRPSGLPRVISNEELSQDIVITPPATQAIFSYVELGEPVQDPVELPPEGDECGGTNLCGIVPFSGFNSFFLTGWFFSSTNLFMGPLF